MIEVVFQEVVLRQICDVRGLDVGDVGRGKDSDVHIRRDLGPNNRISEGVNNAERKANREKPGSEILDGLLQKSEGTTRSG